MAWEPRTMEEYQRIHNAQQEDQGAYLPSEEEIAEQCEAIRRGWTRLVRQQRTVCANPPASIAHMPGGIRAKRAPMVPES